MAIGCFTIIVILVVIFGLSAFEGWIFMLLWNWLTPLFWDASPELTFFQGWGVWILINLIGSAFKTIRGKDR